MKGLTTACSAGFGAPGSDGFLSEPDGEATALAPRGRILRPVAEAVAVLRSRFRAHT